MEMGDNNKYLQREMLFIWPDDVLGVTTHNQYLPGFHNTRVPVTEYAMMMLSIGNLFRITGPL